MKCILNENVALRSWRLVPHAFYIRGDRDAHGLSGEAFELLCRCDGKQDIESAEDLKKIAATGLARPAFEGETLTRWQERRVCDNRYFPALNWMITGKCNYNCLHCFNAADNAPLMSEFSMEEAMRLIDEADRCGINAFTITGGEPMLHKNFFDILEAVYDRGMFVEEINTNGHFIDEASLARLKELDERILIKISFDGIGHHDWMRNREGAEEKALQAFALCKEYGFTVMSQTNVHRKNLDTLMETAETLEEMGVDALRLIRTTEVPRWELNSGGATLSVEEYYEAMLDLIGAYLKKPRQMILNIWQFADIFPGSGTYRARPVECGPGEYRDSLPVCRGARGMVAVTANGNVFPCHQISGFFESRGVCLGNVKEDGLQPLLQKGAYLDEVCATAGDLKKHNTQCGSCPYFKYCAGGCRAVAIVLNGGKWDKDPLKCIFFLKGYYRRLTELMGDWENTAPVIL